MRKNFLTTGFLFSALGLPLVSTVAQASHNVRCDLRAEVVSVTALERLNGEILLSKDEKVVIGDHEALLTVKVVGVVEDADEGEGAFDSCLGEKDSTATFHVSDAQRKEYKEGQILRFYYANVGDQEGSRITWELIKEDPELPDVEK